MKKDRGPKSSPFHRSEYQEQCAVFDWARKMEHKYPSLKLLFGSLMGVKLPVRVLAMMKKAGMKKGKPDIQLPVPRGGFHSLWIELKVRPNDTTPEQNETLGALAAEGNAAYKIYGAAGTVKIIEAYLNNEIRRNENPTSPKHPA